MTSGGLQRGALAYAQSKGIGVVRLLPSEQIVVLLELFSIQNMERASKIDWSEFSVAITTPQHRSKRDFFASQDGYWFANWYSVLSHEFSLAEKA